MKRSSVIMALVLSVTAFVANSFAVPITCTFTGDGSGSLGGVAFADSDFTITTIGDTANRVSFTGGFYIDNGSASIDIVGLGTLNFLTGTRVFVNNSNDTPGFSRAGSSGADLYNGPTSALFSGWDMTTSIGPVAGTMVLMQWLSSPVNTDGGQLVFDYGAPTGTFQAVVGVSVPETSSTLLLLGFALAGLGGLRRKLSS
jgi:hypothetical protein